MAPPSSIAMCSKIVSDFLPRPTRRTALLSGVYTTGIVLAKVPEKDDAALASRMALTSGPCSTPLSSSVLLPSKTPTTITAVFSSAETPEAKLKKDMPTIQPTIKAQTLLNTNPIWH
ncbi:hypothetical protein ANAPH2_00112 [Anaplasma phagocytophilum]|nr:hypothetical protein ANAPH2_00112 [Anaplasma phagocytophilum]